MAKKVCYCFGYTDSDIEQDVLTHGQSLIMDKIMESKKAGLCQCTDTNPKGRWCLADVRQVVDRIMARNGLQKPIVIKHGWTSP